MIPCTNLRLRANSASGYDEVVIGDGGEEENNSSSSRSWVEEFSCNEVIAGRGMVLSEEARRAIAAERVPLVSLADVVGGGGGGGDTHSRIDFQRIAKFVEQILPFSLLLVVVLIRQHLQGMSFLYYIVFKFSCILVWIEVFNV